MRRLHVRVGLLVCLAMPLAIFLGSVPPVDAQMRLERSWKCSRCGGYLGNGVSTPSHCSHCNARMINGGPSQSSRQSQTASSSSATVKGGNLTAVAIVGGLVLLCLGAFIMMGRNPG